MLGPSLVAVTIGVVILVMRRALRRGPAVAARSAPDHGVLLPEARVSDADDVMQRIPAQRRADVRDTAARTVGGQPPGRPAAGSRARPLSRP